MNHIYRVKYNARLGVWVAVSEIARGNSKSGRRIHSRVGVQGVLLRSLLISMTTAGLISSTPSWAACTGTGGSYTCSGITTTTQTLNAPVLNVTADATYQNAGAGTNNGLNLTTTTGGLTASQAAGSVINDNGKGISAQNNGTGSTTISTAGTVTGASAGIYAVNATTATDLTISQITGSIISTGYGIGARNEGSGSTTISTAGTVTGSTGIMVAQANNSGLGKDVTISQTAGAITATNNGIYVMNFGVGGTTINLNSGTIHSDYLGISLENGPSTTGLTINQSADHTITSNNYAIQTTDEGAADTNITLAGTVSATTVGVNAIHYSTGTLNITQNGGSISGDNRAGVRANGQAAINVTQNGGSISSASGTGVILTSIFGNGPLSLTQNTGSISGNYGVVIDNIGTENTILTQTAGNIVGTAGDGIYITNGLVFGDTTYAYGTDIAINIAGTVSGTQNGISAYNYGSGQMNITSSGIISGAGTTASSAEPNNPVSGNGIYANNMTGATDLTISQTAGVISGDSNGIEAINTGSGPTTVAVAGEVIGGSGAGIHTSGTAGAPVDITLNSGAKVSATSGVAIKDDAGNATLTMNGGSKLTGQVLMGEGNDTMIIKDSADISGVTLLDGGNSTDSTVTDILGTATAATNKLTFENSTSSLSGSIIKNWQTVTLDGSNLTFIGDAALVTGTGTNSDSSLQGLVIQNGATLSSPVTLDVTGDVSIDATSTLSHSQGGSITGNVTSAGLIDWQSATPGQTLTINGNYTGVSGSRLLLQTVLGDDSSLTDKLVVTGDSAGTTSVSVRNAGGSGAQTLNGIELIHINGTSNGVFTQAGRIVAGVYEYSLARGQGSNSSNWYLTNQKTVQERIPTPTPEPNPNPTPEPNPGSDGPVINTMSEVKSAATLRPEINSYTENLAAANTLFNTRLHDRLGETQYIDVLTGEKKVTSMWLRQIGGHNNWRSGGGQLQTQSNRYVIQMGGDVAQWSTDGLDRLHLGLMMGYAHENNHTRSSVTGYGSKGSLDGYSVGAYATWYANDANHNGLYIDSWAQYGWFNNYVHGDELAQESYKSRGMTASVESGYTYKLGTFTGSLGTLNEWYIRPVAQITWMGVKADDHREDNGTSVQGEGHGNIQTRLGLRTYLKSHNKMDDGKDREFQPFIEANWLHNTRNFATRMNGVSISQDGANNVGEIKLGVEGQLNPRLNLWGNVGVQVGDKGYNDSVAMVGVKVNF